MLAGRQQAHTDVFWEWLDPKPAAPAGCQLGLSQSHAQQKGLSGMWVLCISLIPCGLEVAPGYSAVCLPIVLLSASFPPTRPAPFSLDLKT